MNLSEKTVPILISLVVHGVLFLSLYKEKPEFLTLSHSETDNAISIRLGSSLPLRTDPGVAAESVAPAVEAQQQVAESLPHVRPGPQTPSAPPRLVDQRQTGSSPEAPRAPRFLPTAEEIRRSIEANLSRSGSSAPQPLCTEAQRRSEMFDCPSEYELTLPEARSRLQFSARSAQRDSRLRQTIGAIAGSTGLIAENLAAAGASAQAIERITSGIEAANADYSGSGNARLDALLDQQFRNDSTWQLMKSVMEPR
jgi:hypothetical protein